MKIVQKIRGYRASRINKHYIYVLMNRYALLLIFFLFCIPGYSQDRFAVEAGIGQPPSYSPLFFSLSDGPTVVQSGRTAPCVTLSWLRKAGSHIYIGSKLTFNTYNFTYSSNINKVAFNLFSNSPDSSSGTTVVCKSTYMGIAPTFDVGIGKRHQYVHLFLMPAINFLLKGTMSTELYQNYTGSAIYDHTQNTSGYLNPILFHMNLGLVEHLPVSKEWHITLSETLSMMIPNSAIADAKGTNGLTITPTYLNLQLGLMHKYHSAQSSTRQE